MFDKVFGDFVEMGISLLVAAALLSGITVCMGLSNQYNEKQLENQVIAEDIQEHRNNLFYNGTHVYQQDIVSMVLKYKGSRSVVVKLSNGSVYEWSSNKKATDYKVSEISSKLPKDKIYDADLIKGASGEVVGYSFVQCTRADYGR